MEHIFLPHFRKFWQQVGEIVGWQGHSKWWYVLRNSHFEGIRGRHVPGRFRGRWGEAWGRRKNKRNTSELGEGARGKKKLQRAEKETSELFHIDCISLWICWCLFIYLFIFTTVSPLNDHKMWLIWIPIFLSVCSLFLLGFISMLLHLFMRVPSEALHFIS